MIRGRSSGSGEIDGDVDNEEDGMEGLMSGGNDGGGKKQVRTSHWRVHHNESGDGGFDCMYDGEMDRDSDWEGMVDTFHQMFMHIWSISSTV